MKMQVGVCAASIAVMAMVLLPLVASTSATSQHSAPLVLRSAGSGAAAAAVGLQVRFNCFYETFSSLSSGAPA